MSADFIEVVEDFFRVISELDSLKEGYYIGKLGDIVISDNCSSIKYSIGTEEPLIELVRKGSYYKIIVNTSEKPKNYICDNSSKEAIKLTPASLLEIKIEVLRVLLDKYKSQR